MGFFDFLKNVGTDMFGGGKDEATEIQNLLTENLGDKISQLKVEFDDGNVKLGGQCDSNRFRFLYHHPGPGRADCNFSLRPPDHG